MATTDTYTSNDTWVAPTGVTYVVVECWGAGGDSGTSALGGVAGAGGGAYARKAMSVTPGNSYTVTVGASNGADSWFSTPGMVLAKGGSSTGANDLVGGQGGQASSCIGDVKYSGGNGGNGTGTTNGSQSGSGGGGAGSTGNGGNGSTSNTPGTGTANGGGDGGAGQVSVNADGTNGSVAGGGAGGACRTSGTRAGGTGASGKVSITYAVAVGSDTSGTPVDSATLALGIIVSDTAGIPEENTSLKFNWKNATKNISNWINGDKH